jgi:hypothetical protein
VAELPPICGFAESMRMEAKKGLDSNSPKPRGPHRQIEPTTVLGRADNYRWILQQVWDSVWPSLSGAQSPEDIIKALENARPYDREFVPWAAAILGILKEERFPKRRKARANFIADSIAGIPNVSPRRSRDICVEERARRKRAHHIIRYEFYIVCSCGRKGHSVNHACPKCRAEIQIQPDLGSAFA